MNILLCIDDTDNLESPGTGHLASLLMSQLEERGWARGGLITRHQLLIHPDIPYTSHNSAMCCAAYLHEDCPPDQLAEYAGRFLAKESAPGSDPGLCLAIPDLLSDAESLVAFGRAAKKQVLAKSDAYNLARRLGIHLSEHGGTGQGVVGALAGVGLRLEGNDGRLKGRLNLGAIGERLSVADLLAHPWVDRVHGLDGTQPQENELVELGDKVKTVLLDGCSVLMLDRVNDQEGIAWRTCSRQQLRSY